MNVRWLARDEEVGFLAVYWRKKTRKNPNSTPLAEACRLRQEADTPSKVGSLGLYKF